MAACQYYLIIVCVALSVVGSGMCGPVQPSPAENLEQHYPDLFKHFQPNAARFVKDIQDIMKTDSAASTFNDVTKRVCEELSKENPQDCISKIKTVHDRYPNARSSAEDLNKAQDDIYKDLNEIKKKSTPSAAAPSDVTTSTAPSDLTDSTWHPNCATQGRIGWIPVVIMALLFRQ